MDEEEWMRLCRRAVVTSDPDTLRKISLEINRMLYLKQQHLKDTQLASLILDSDR